MVAAVVRRRGRPCAANGNDRIGRRGRTERHRDLSLRRHESRRTHGPPARQWRHSARRGRADPVGAADRLMHEAGSRYIDFLIPGLVGIGIMGNSIWDSGLCHRRRPAQEAAEAHHGHADAAPRLSALVPVVPDADARDRGGRARRVRRAGVCSTTAGVRARAGRAVRAGLAGVERARAARRVARTNHRGRFGAGEHRDGADVGPLRRVLLRAEVSKTPFSR